MVKLKLPIGNPLKLVLEVLSLSNVIIPISFSSAAQSSPLGVDALTFEGSIRICPPALKKCRLAFASLKVIKNVWKTFPFHTVVL